MKYMITLLLICDGSDSLIIIYLRSRTVAKRHTNRVKSFVKIQKKHLQKLSPASGGERNFIILSVNNKGMPEVEQCTG